MTTLVYDSDLAEAAWITATEVDPGDTTEGLSASWGGDTGSDGWNGYVTVKLQSLTDRGHADLACRIADAYGPLASFDAWLTTAQDRVTLVSWGHDEGARSGTDALWQSWLAGGGQGNG